MLEHLNSRGHVLNSNSSRSQIQILYEGEEKERTDALAIWSCKVDNASVIACAAESRINLLSKR